MIIYRTKPIIAHPKTLPGIISHEGDKDSIPNEPVKVCKMPTAINQKGRLSIRSVAPVDGETS